MKQLPLMVNNGANMASAISTQEVTVTPEIAKQWIAEYSFDRQRKLRKYWVSFLAESMRRGTFAPYTTVQFTIGPDGHHVITDGQHRLHAIIESGKSQQFLCVFRHGDPATHYTMHDQGKPRGILDTYAALDLPNEFGLVPKNIRYLGSAAHFIHFGFQESKGRKLQNDDRLAIMGDYADAAVEYFQSILGANQILVDPLRRISTVSVGLVTMRHAPEKMAWDFWRGIALNDGLKTGDPRKTAMTHLITTATRNTKGNSVTVVDPDYSARYLSNCWNAWAEGRKLTKTQVKMDRIRIALTPYAEGGQ